MKSDTIIAIMFGCVVLGALWAVLTGKLDDPETVARKQATACDRDRFGGEQDAECDAKSGRYHPHCICKFHKPVCDCASPELIEKLKTSPWADRAGTYHGPGDDL